MQLSIRMCGTLTLTDAAQAVVPRGVSVDADHVVLVRRGPGDGRAEDLDHRPAQTVHARTHGHVGQRAHRRRTDRAHAAGQVRPRPSVLPSSPLPSPFLRSPSPHRTAPERYRSRHSLPVRVPCCALYSTRTVNAYSYEPVARPSTGATCST